MWQHIHAGKTLWPDDVHTQTPEHLISVKATGDVYWREIIADRECDDARSVGRECNR